MSKKYKELPAFETNEFEVGDLVRVYDNQFNREPLIVTHVFEDIINVNTGVIIPIHFKQCRKLEEVKPREIYVTFNDEGYPDKAYGTRIHIPICAKKFREVLDDE